MGFLGLVDDIVGITESGHEAQMLNSFINVKTADKMLQFGPAKCKSMMVGKNTEKVLNNPLHVDNWKVEYVENKETGDVDLVESYEGKVEIEKTDEYTYLGFVISSKGENMANIRQVKKKSPGTIRRILNKLNSMNLRQYYFESAILLMNLMLRGSILYAADMYYNLKESEVREIERIEEGYLRRILKTTKGCPLTQLYLELGQHPARFEVQKMRLLYLKYILEQGDESTLKKFLNLQFEKPSRGDWGSRCMKDLKELNIDLSLDKIKIMTKNKFKNILKEKIKENALEYLLRKQGSKGKEMKYKCLEMADYLQPFDNVLTIEEKQYVFSLRNRMLNIPYNIGNNKHECYCGELEDQKHVYNCEILSENKDQKCEYENIFKGNNNQQKEIMQIFKENMDTREKLNFPCDPDVIRCHSNG